MERHVRDRSGARAARARRRGAWPPDAYHPHDITERYAPFTIIVLGEVILASVAATGAALAGSVDVATHEAHASPRSVGLALASAIAVYFITLGVFHALGDGRARSATSALVAAAVVLAVAAVGWPIGVTVLLTGLVLAAAVAHHVRVSRGASPA